MLYRGMYKESLLAKKDIKLRTVLQKEFRQNANFEYLQNRFIKTFRVKLSTTEDELKKPSNCIFNDYSSDASVGVSTELSNKSTAPPGDSHQTRRKSEMLQEGTAILRKHIQLPNEERFKLGFTTLIGNIITNHIFIRITTNRTNEKAT